jgi:TatA/E family protein of Tat protein translocase
MSDERQALTHHSSLITHHFFMPLLVLEFLGTTELMVIAFVALVIFGPRRLPEFGRTIGRWMAEFKRASEDFKRTWEYEVEVERRPSEPEAGTARGQLEGHNEADMAAPEADWTPEPEPDVPAAPEIPDDPEAALTPVGETVARATAYEDATPQPAAGETAGVAATAPERESV